MQLHAGHFFYNVKCFLSATLVVYVYVCKPTTKCSAGQTWKTCEEKRAVLTSKLVFNCTENTLQWKQGARCESLFISTHLLFFLLQTTDLHQHLHSSQQLKCLHAHSHAEPFQIDFHVEVHSSSKSGSGMLLLQNDRD